MGDFMGVAQTVLNINVRLKFLNPNSKQNTTKVVPKPVIISYTNIDMNNVLLNGTEMESVTITLDRIIKRTAVSQQIAFISKIPSFQKYMPGCRLTHRLLTECLHIPWESLTLGSIQNDLDKSEIPKQTQHSDIFMEIHLLN